ncbi:PepSY domain-containing protein [Azonexus sp.]|uniref:PepSY domain-containing protein n=1 Tax=Azonexus sp. TaxID=1872668 RepID=UPI0035AFC034
MQISKFPRRFVLALTLGGIIAVGAVLADNHRERHHDERGEAGWLPIPALVSRLEAAGYRNVEEIEREHGRYEVRVTDRNGERRKLYFDGRTGESLGAGRAEGVPRERVVQPADGRECNKRRCRDDLPATPAGGAKP